MQAAKRVGCVCVAHRLRIRTGTSQLHTQDGLTLCRARFRHFSRLCLSNTGHKHTHQHRLTHPLIPRFQVHLGFFRACFLLLPPPTTFPPHVGDPFFFLSPLIIMSTTEVETLVIGAGPTGLGAAKRLNQLVSVATNVQPCRRHHTGSLTTSSPLSWYFSSILSEPRSVAPH